MKMANDRQEEVDLQLTESFTFVDQLAEEVARRTDKGDLFPSTSSSTLWQGMQSLQILVDLQKKG